MDTVSRKIIRVNNLVALSLLSAVGKEQGFFSRPAQGQLVILLL